MGLCDEIDLLWQSQSELFSYNSAVPLIPGQFANNNYVLSIKEWPYFFLSTYSYI